ncbi:MAG: hypothetical protein ACRDCT_26210, partial [Shewanella sp.]
GINEGAMLILRNSRGRELACRALLSAFLYGVDGAFSVNYVEGRVKNCHFQRYVILAWPPTLQMVILTSSSLEAAKSVFSSYKDGKKCCNTPSPLPPHFINVI